jgi:hypothetical protein
MGMTKVFASTVIDLSVVRLWQTLRDFGNIARWHPDVADSHLEEGGAGAQVAAVRALHLQNGAAVRERLLALSDVEFYYTYSVIESPFPVRNHRSTVRLFPVTTSDQTFVSWEAEFEVTEGGPATMAQGVLQGVILLGFEGLRGLASGQ